MIFLISVSPAFDLFSFSTLHLGLYDNALSIRTPEAQLTNFEAGTEDFPENQQNFSHRSRFLFNNKLLLSVATKLKLESFSSLPDTGLFNFCSNNDDFVCCLLFRPCPEALLQLQPST